MGLYRSHMNVRRYRDKDSRCVRIADVDRRNDCLLEIERLNEAIQVNRQNAQVISNQAIVIIYPVLRVRSTARVTVCEISNA